MSQEVVRLYLHSEDKTLEGLQKLAKEAWTDRECLEVLIDALASAGSLPTMSAELSARLSEALQILGVIPVWAKKETRTPAEVERYHMETAAREWIVSEMHPHLELRVDGVWPRMEYVVWRKNPNVRLSEATSMRRFGAWSQPRLLAFVTDDCKKQLHNVCGWTCLLCSCPCHA